MCVFASACMYLVDTIYQSIKISDHSECILNLLQTTS